MREIEIWGDLMCAISIGDRRLGKGFPTYIIAEVGSNHNNDFDTAKEMIKVAADAGVDAIKFQTFSADKHYSRYSPNFGYLSENKNHLSTYELIKSLEMNRDWHQLLIDDAYKYGITFLTSACDYHAVQDLYDLGMQAFKVASFDLPDLELIRFMAHFKKTMILSTGMANYIDIQRAVDVCREVGNEQIILLQCTSLYPAPFALSNLSAIDTLKRSFGVEVGYSDHTIGDHVSIAAVALGAHVIEKHFTLDKSQSGPDHRFAIEPSDLKEMVKKIRNIESAIGSGFKFGPHKEEQEMFEKGRRSIHTARCMKVGDVIRREDLCIKRPGYGIEPSMIEVLVGMVVQTNIKKDHWITWDDLKKKVKHEGETINFVDRGRRNSSSISH
jgi:sialic acid synthase SpsE